MSNHLLKFIHTSSIGVKEEMGAKNDQYIQSDSVTCGDTLYQYGRVNRNPTTFHRDLITLCDYFQVLVSIPRYGRSKIAKARGAIKYIRRNQVH